MSESKKRFAFCLLLFSFLFYACAAWRGGSQSVHPIDEKGLQQLIQQARGKVVLLNFWATWCDPCVEEIPDLIKIAGEFRPRGLEMILVSIDEPEEVGKKVVPFLKAQRIGFRTYVKHVKDDEVFINLIDANWSGVIPATFIYDANGVLVTRLIAQQDFATFATALRPLLPKNIGQK